MPLVKAHITVTDERVVLDHQDLLKEFPARVVPVINRTVKRVKNRVAQRFRKAPARPHFPWGQFPWKSRRQQQAFFASNGFGRGIPTYRSNVLIKSWQVIVVPRQGQIPGIGIYNPVHYRKFVTGRYQQPFHAGRWYKEADLFKQARAELNAEANKDILALFDEVTRHD